MLEKKLRATVLITMLALAGPVLHAVPADGVGESVSGASHNSHGKDDVEYNGQIDPHG